MTYQNDSESQNNDLVSQNNKTFAKCQLKTTFVVLVISFLFWDR